MKRIISIALCFMLVFTLCPSVFAAGDTMTWTGTSSGNWNVAGNWNPAQVPGMGDTAVVPASTVAAAVYDTTSVTLDCSGEVSVESGKYLYLTGTSYLRGGKLSGDGDVTIMVDDSELQWSGGSIEGNGTFTVGENTRLVIDIGSDVGMSRPFENNGQIMINEGELLLAGGSGGIGTFAVSDGAYLCFREGDYSIGGTFTNDGDISIWDTSSVRFNADYKQESTGTLALKVWGAESDQYCKLDVAGAAELGGILEIDFINDYDPSPGDSFEIVTCGSRANEFFEIRNNMEGITLVPTYTETGLKLTVSGGAAKVWEVKDATELETALNGFKSGDTIKLLDNITYTNDSGSFAITIDGENITFDLSGNNLTINNNSGYGVELKNRAKMTFTDSTGGGKLFIDTGASGLSAGGGSTFESDGSVAVTINSRIGSGISANNATVNIQDGSVSVSAGYSHGVSANTDCMITVNGPVTVNNVSGSNLAAVYLSGPGNTVNVGSAVVTGGTGHGVSIRESGTVTVGSSASPGSVTGTNAGIYIMGGTARTHVTVYGDVEGVSYGICAFYDAEIEVYGDVTSTSTTDTEACGVYIHAGSGPSSLIEIDGNVEGPRGMEFRGASSTARVTGNVTANGSDPNYVIGVCAEDAMAEIGGNVNAVSGIGAMAGENGQITVDGSISASKYIMVRGMEKTIDDKTLPTTKDGGYHTYNNGTATVWVKDSGTAEFAGGNGSEDNPYLIATADHLNNVRNHLNKHFRQTANINLSDYNSGEGWEPIGMLVDFTGSFDGGGHTISGLVINRPDQDDIGLFGYAETTAKIRNLGLVGVNVTGCNYVGGLVGGNRGLVTNSYVTGDVNGESQVGGLVGENLESGTITNCHAEVTVTSSHSGLVGGLVGENYGAISESYAVGEVEGTDVVGGLVGFSSGNIDKSYATGTVTGTETDANLCTCVGGLVGNNDGPISNSFARGAVSGQEDIGGLAGHNRGSITNSYSTGAVSGNIDIGGLVGSNYSDDITDSYWDKETSLLNTSAGGTGKTTAEMKQQITYEGWDFDTLWGINSSKNNGYPFLKWQVKATVWEVANVTQLETALNGFQSDDTIKLAANIDYKKGITIDGKNITFDTGSFTLSVNSSTDYASGVGLEVINGGNVYLIGSGQFNIRQMGGSASYGVKATGGSTAIVTNIEVTVFGDDSAFGAYADGTNSSIQVLGNVHVMGVGGCGAKTSGRGKITIDGTITAWTYINIGTTFKDKSSGVVDPEKSGYLKYSTEPVTGIVWVKASPVTVPAAPQNFTATPADGQVALSWSAPASDGGAAIIRYEVSSDNGGTWVTAATNTSHTFTGLTNGTEYTFKVRAVNSVGNGEEASAAATPIATPTPTYTVTVTKGAGGGEFAQGFTVTITANPAPSGQRFKEWQVISGGITLVNSQEASTSFQMPANAVEVAATYETIPEITYTVTVNGSYAAVSGAGSYAQDVTVTIDAGSRTNYSFNGWTSLDGVTFTNSNSATTTFIMPPRSVTVTANWTYRGGGGSGGGGSSTPTTPAAPSYKADVKAENGTETTLPVTVDKDTGTASVNIGSQGLDQGRTNITIPSIPDVDTYSVGIPVPDLSTSDIQGTLTVNTDAGNITIPSNMLTGVSGISGSKAEIAIGQGDKDNLPDTVKAAIGDRPLLQLSLSIDGKQTDWSNPDAPVTVSISYTPTAAELANPESIVVWYIDGSGNVVSVPNGRYDPTTGMVTFTTAHFSDYAVAYNKVSFNDVAADAWYHKAVSFIAARGITGGTGNGNYSPEARLTRGQFVVMLMKAYGISPDADLKNNFADAGSAYYTGYLAAAKRLSISSGVGNNMFEPEKEITRQEMFTLLYNALKIIGRLPQNDSGKTLSDFTDSGQIDSWAREAMALLVETGTIGGNAGKLNPTSTTTRAEMAQVLYNLLSK